jgi:hypothetical protein
VYGLIAIEFDPMLNAIVLAVLVLASKTTRIP